MDNRAPFGITESDIKRYSDKQSKNGIDNHPVRNTETTTFFQAMMSDEADFIKHGVVTKESAKLLGEGNG